MSLWERFVNAARSQLQCLHLRLSPTPPTRTINRHRLPSILLWYVLGGLVSRPRSRREEERGLPPSPLHTVRFHLSRTTATHHREEDISRLVLRTVEFFALYRGSFFFARKKSPALYAPPCAGGGRRNGLRDLEVSIRLFSRCLGSKQPSHPRDEPV